MTALGRENITMNMHQSGIEPLLFKENPTLAAFYDLLATNKATSRPPSHPPARSV